MYILLFDVATVDHLQRIYHVCCLTVSQDALTHIVSEWRPCTFINMLASNHAIKLVVAYESAKVAKEYATQLCDMSQHNIKFDRYISQVIEMLVTNLCAMYEASFEFEFIQECVRPKKSSTIIALLSCTIHIWLQVTNFILYGRYLAIDVDCDGTHQTI